MIGLDEDSPRDLRQIEAKVGQCIEMRACLGKLPACAVICANYSGPSPFHPFMPIFGEARCEMCFSYVDAANSADGGALGTRHAVRCQFRNKHHGSHSFQVWPPTNGERPQSVHDQPPPVKNDRPAVWDLVMADIKERDEVGTKRYGTRLQPFNGRDAITDAYQEALDMVVYLRQAIEEREQGPETIRDQVTAFHEKFGVAVNTKPHVPPRDVVRFRARLIAEEFFEVMYSIFAGDNASPQTLSMLQTSKGLLATVTDHAMPHVDMVEFADGLADLDYVVEGARLTFGINGEAVAAEVQRSNMAKVGGPTRRT